MEKTAYEVRISDGSSDVCSSVLAEWGGLAGDEHAMQLHVPAGRFLTRHGRCLPRRQARTHPTPRIFALQFQLPVQLAPLAHAQEAAEVAVAPLAQLRLGHVLVSDAVGVPEPEDANELGLRVQELRAPSVCRRAPDRWQPAAVPGA